MLNVNSIKMEVARGLQDYEVAFEQMEDLINAVEAVNRFNEEKNSFIRDSFLVAKNNAEAFIFQWKITHSKKVQLVMEEKEKKKQEKAKKTKEAISLLPKLSKAYNEVESLINQIAILDDGVLKSPYMSVHSFNRKSFEEIHNEFKSCIAETISKGVK